MAKKASKSKAKKKGAPKSAEPTKSVKSAKAAKTKQVSKSAKANSSAKKLTSKSFKKTPSKASSKKSIPSSRAVRVQESQQFQDLLHRISPLRSRVVILRDEEAEKTPGGLYIPSNAQDRPQAGKVVAAGKGALSKRGVLHPLDVQVGDRVLFNRYAGSEVSVGQDTVMIMEESEILGVIQD